MTEIKSQRKPENATPTNQNTDSAVTLLSKQTGEPRTQKALQKPKFGEKLLGPVIIKGEADSALYMGQDERYGTTLTENQGGGDFSNKIVLAVGFLNEGKSDGSEVKLYDPNLRYGAGLTIYQRTDTGKDQAFEKGVTSSDKKLKNKERKATTLSPQKAVSVIEMNADVIELKARNGGVNIIAGIDPTIPSYGDKEDRDGPNVNYVGVSLIGGGNPNTDVLSDPDNVRGLQPMVKGITLQKRMTEMTKRISDVNKVVLKVIKSQKILEAALALHVHPVIPLVPVTGPSIDLAIAIGAVKTPLDIFNVLSNITAKYNQVALGVNCSSVSKGGFTSQFNKTN